MPGHIKELLFLVLLDPSISQLESGHRWISSEIHFLVESSSGCPFFALLFFHLRGFGKDKTSEAPERAAFLLSFMANRSLSIMYTKTWHLAILCTLVLPKVPQLVLGHCRKLWTNEFHAPILPREKTALQMSAYACAWPKVVLFG